MTHKWVPLLGEFAEEGTTLVFKGRQLQVEGQFQPMIGNLLCDSQFAGGSLEADVQFAAIDQYTACELMLYYDPGSRSFVTAGLGGSGMLCSIRSFSNRWTVLATAGDRSNLRPGVVYHLAASFRGSLLSLSIDGVEALRAQLPASLPPSQVGVWCMSEGNISVSGLTVRSERPEVFVVMEFSSPYNEIYSEVIKCACQELGVEPVRADERFGPGIIIADIVRQITAAKAVVAEITPANPNVYYEVGYAHALGKPTILIADKVTKD